MTHYLWWLQIHLRNDTFFWLGNQPRNILYNRESNPCHLYKDPQEDHTIEDHYHLLHYRRFHRIKYQLDHLPPTFYHLEDGEGNNKIHNVLIIKGKKLYKSYVKTMDVQYMAFCISLPGHGPSLISFISF